MLPRLEHGSRVTLNVNGRVFAQAMAFEWSSETPKRPARGIDIPFALELCPTTISGRGTVQIYRMIGDGGIQGVNLAAQQIDVNREKYSSITLVDSVTKLVLFKADFCSVESESWSVPAKSLITGTVTFTGIIITNELATT